MKLCLHVFQNTMFVPWLQGLSVTELDGLGEAKRTTLDYELEKVLLNKFGNDQDRIRDEFKSKLHGFWAPKHLMWSLQQCLRVL